MDILDYLVKIEDVFLSLKNVVKRYGEDKLLFFDNDNNMVFECPVGNVKFVLEISSGSISYENVIHSMVMEIQY